ncbi:MAG: hypothetical protein ACM3TN_02145 [Alphaproteobacteria bacterium]
MGPTNGSDYTMVGDSINIASRLQGKAASDVTALGTRSPDAVRVEYLVKGISSSCLIGTLNSAIITSLRK